MSKEYQYKNIIHFLESNPNTRFSAREIAEAITKEHPNDYYKENKKISPSKLILQTTADIGLYKKEIHKICPHVFWQDMPRPRVYWYNPDATQPIKETFDFDLVDNSTDEPQHYYPELFGFLKFELNLFCHEIGLKHEANICDFNLGYGWLYPNIVAMKPIDSDWIEAVQNCAHQEKGNKISLWSFYVEDN